MNFSAAESLPLAPDRPPPVRRPLDRSEKRHLCNLALQFFSAPPNSQARDLAWLDIVHYQFLVKHILGGRVPAVGVPTGPATTIAALLAYIAGLMEGDGHIGMKLGRLASGVYTLGAHFSICSVKAGAVCREIYAMEIYAMTQPGGALAALFPAALAGNFGGVVFTARAATLYECANQAAVAVWYDLMLPFAVTKYQSMQAAMIMVPDARLGLRRHLTGAALAGLRVLSQWHTGP